MEAEVFLLFEARWLVGCVNYGFTAHAAERTVRLRAAYSRAAVQQLVHERLCFIVQSVSALLVSYVALKLAFKMQILFNTSQSKSQPVSLVV
ncbi:uncharacterized protein V6R79_018062 [Siganus canaliculatus]